MAEVVDPAALAALDVVDVVDDVDDVALPDGAPLDVRQMRTSRTTTSATARRPIGVLVGVFITGTLVGLLFAASLPRWAIEDEPQHVDYVDRLAHTGSVPAVGDELAPSIVTAMFDDDRWAAYGQPAPPGTDQADLGLAGRSYLAYHPPLPYLALAVVDAIVPGTTVDHLPLLRLATAIAFGAVCALTALLAARLAARTGRRATPWGPLARRAALGAGVAMAFLPVAADAGGRVNTDVFGMLAVLLVVFAVLRWHDRPARDRAMVVGISLAGAVLTRETAVVVLVPLAAAVASTAARRQLRGGDVVWMLAPAATCELAWMVVVRLRTGQAVGPQAFVDTYGAPFPGVTAGDVLRQLPTHALVPYGEWPVAALLSLLVVAAIGIGLVAASRAGLAGPVLIAVAMAVVQVLIVVVGAVVGFSTVTGRLLLPVMPVLLALAAVGWATVRRRTGSLVWVGVTVLFGLAFIVFDQLPRYGLGH